MTANRCNPSISCRRHEASAPRWLAAVLVLGITLGAAPSFAFDTGPHFDMTEDALRSVGFASPQSIRTVQAANFLVDFHEFMRKDILKSVKLPAEVKGVKVPTQVRDKFEIPILDPVCRAEMAEFLEVGDDSMHFDDLDLPGRVATRWDAMLAATESEAKKMAMAKDPDILGLLALLGMSLHNVQDFYTHSNWVEQNFGNPGIGTGKLADYGKYPTYLSVPRAIRKTLNVYTQIPKDKTLGRVHGEWDTDWKEFERPGLSLNKDWAGRRYYEPAYLCAYFATVQWTRLFRSYLADYPGVWDRMLRFNLGNTSYNPTRDWEYARRISFYGGHWNGNGGPTGKDALTSKTAATSPQFLIASAVEYMGGLCLTKNRSALRFKVQDLLKTWAKAKYEREVDPPNLPKPDPQVTFAKLEVLRVDGIDTGDGSVLPDQLDWYARIRFGGQSYWSCLIDEHNSFNFVNPPYAPWTIYKALSTQRQDEELTSLIVTLRTGDDINGVEDGAGTDDELELRLGGSTRWLKIRAEKKHLEKNAPLETFSIRVAPDTIGAESLPLPYTMGQIQGISIRKPKHGKNGNWRMAGIEVKANGYTIYSYKDVDVWLNATKTTWDAPDFRVAGAQTNSDVPVCLRLMELDAVDHKDDDHADINPNVGARDIGFLYSPTSEQTRGDVKGPSPYEVAGVGGSDKARLKFRVTKVVGTSR